MRKLAWDSSFRQAFKRQTRRDRILQDRIFDVLDQLARDPFLPTLKAHKLSGQLQGLWAAWVEYDCRIIFSFADPPPTPQNNLHWQPNVQFPDRVAMRVEAHSSRLQYNP